MNRDDSTAGREPAPFDPHARPWQPGEHSPDPFASPPDDDGPPGFPWPPADDESVPGALAATWQGASLRPATFFRAMPARGSLGAALLYYLPIGILVAGADLFWTTVRGGASDADIVLDSAPSLPPLVSFLLSPVLLIASLFVAAGATHILLRIVGGANRDFAFTTRLFAFAYSPQILGVVPAVGVVVGFVWMVVIAIIGIREGHGTSTARAAAAVLIPVFIGLAFLAVAWFMGMLLQMDPLAGRPLAAPR